MKHGFTYKIIASIGLIGIFICFLVRYVDGSTHRLIAEKSGLPITKDMIIVYDKPSPITDYVVDVKLSLNEEQTRKLFESCKNNSSYTIETPYQSMNRNYSGQLGSRKPGDTICYNHNTNCGGGLCTSSLNITQKTFEFWRYEE